MNNQQRAAMQMAWEYIDWLLSGNLSEPAHEALDVEAALREALAQPQDQDLAYREAKSLAEHLFKKHYANQEDYASGRIVWGVCDTTAGIITQIDNMVCKLELPLTQDHSEQHLNMVQGEWVDLTPQEVTEAIREGAADGGWQDFAQRIIAKFKEKQNV